MNFLKVLRGRVSAVTYSHMQLYEDIMTVDGRWTQLFRGHGW